jgi:hypothetical protein
MAESVIEIISDIDGFVQLHEYLEDEDIDKALTLIVKLISNPDVVQMKVAPLIVKVQALSAKYQVLAAVHSTIAKGKAGSVDNNKKNLYYSISSALDKLAQSLKYLIRQTY